MFPVFERAKTVHALDRAVTVIGKFETTFPKTGIDKRGTQDHLSSPMWRHVSFCAGMKRTSECFEKLRGIQM
jgi:hypothetical protein